MEGFITDQIQVPKARLKVLGEVYVVTWIRSKVMEDMVQIWCEAMEIMNTK